MRIVSISEDQQIEKRIAITPEIAKKYVSLGFELSLSENYGEHLGFNDNEYKELGVKISNNEVPEGAAQVVLGTTTLVFPLATNINIGEEKSRLEREIIRLDKEINRIANKLGNKSFVEKAPKKVVEDEMVKRDDYERSRSKVKEALERLV